MTLLHRIPARLANVGGTDVRRLLPISYCRQVGPWVFVDHFGPVTREVSAKTDVLPHPHIGLSTVSYLFEGAVEHRDSQGGHAIIRPGEVHWMRAGNGIVHSERAPTELLGTIQTASGLQLWCAHPDGEEDQAPAFGSWRDLPELDVDGTRIQLLAGQGWNSASPVEVTSNLIYAIAHMNAGAQLPLPDHEERCVYPITGEIAVDGVRAGAGDALREMLVVDASARTITAVTDAAVVVLGGDRIGKRYFWWNLVHSDKATLRQQAERWMRREFPLIPGDDKAFADAPPLP